MSSRRLQKIWGLAHREDQGGRRGDLRGAFYLAEKTFSTKREDRPHIAKDRRLSTTTTGGDISYSNRGAGRKVWEIGMVGIRLPADYLAAPLTGAIGTIKKRRRSGGRGVDRQKEKRRKGGRQRAEAENGELEDRNLF